MRLMGTASGGRVSSAARPLQFQPDLCQQGDRIMLMERVWAKSVHPSTADIGWLRRHVCLVPILLQKSFCITEHNFSGL
jgi:hypothetical protein